MLCSDSIAIGLLEFIIEDFLCNTATFGVLQPHNTDGLVSSLGKKGYNMFLNMLIHKSTTRNKPNL